MRINQTNHKEKAAVQTLLPGYRAQDIRADLAITLILLVLIFVYSSSDKVQKFCEARIEKQPGRKAAVWLTNL